MDKFERNTSIIHILGLGESLDEFKPDENLTIGVNDIYSKYASDYVVCVDHPSAFDNDRRKTIQRTNSNGFYSHVKEWKSVQNFRMIDFAPGRGNLHYIDDQSKLICSNSSPYVAAVLAYRFGAKEIILHGVDFRRHPNFSNDSLNLARLHFRELSKALKERNVQIFVGSNWSMLSEFLPVWKIER